MDFKKIITIVFILSMACQACPFAKFVSSEKDIKRSNKSKPDSKFTAKGARNIRRKLNDHLVNGSTKLPRSNPCEQFTLQQLNKLEHELFCLRNGELASKEGKRQAKHFSIESLGKKHEENEMYVKENPETHDALRDAQCHEITMSWVHHLTETARKYIRESTDFLMPLLPELGFEEHLPELLKGGHTKIIDQLQKSVTCQIGHEATKHERVKWEGFPHWPAEVTYQASGYGPYPFWTGGPGGNPGKLSGKGTNITTSWSDVLNAEKLVHASCDLKSMGGSNGVPCTHLFLDDAYAFLYSEEDNFCCMSSAPAMYDKCHITRPQRDFMDVFNYDGVIDYTSEDGLYTGKAKKYSMHLSNPSNFFFWYVTDLSGKPLEQGEGPCNMYESDGSRNCRGGGPKMLFHQYHQDTFKEATLDASVFELPSICSRTMRKNCEIQPQNFCGDSETMEKLRTMELPEFTYQKVMKNRK